MRKHILLAMAVFVVGASGAAAQDAVPVLPGEPDATAELAKIVADTKAKGLPVDAILEKVHHGMQIHAPPALVVAAARAVAVRLEISRKALAPRDIPPDVTAGEGALSYGVPKDALTAVRRASSEKSVAVPLGVLTQLVASQVTPKRALDYVTSLLRRGVSGQQLASLSNDVNSDVKAGGRFEDALNVRMRLLTAALAPAGGSAAATTDPGLTSASTPHKKP